MLTQACSPASASTLTPKTICQGRIEITQWLLQTRSRALCLADSNRPSTSRMTSGSNDHTPISTVSAMYRLPASHWVTVDQHSIPARLEQSTRLCVPCVPESSTGDQKVTTIRPGAMRGDVTDSSAGKDVEPGSRQNRHDQHLLTCRAGTEPSQTPADPYASQRRTPCQSTGRVQPHPGQNTAKRTTHQRAATTRRTRPVPTQRDTSDYRNIHVQKQKNNKN